MKREPKDPTKISDATFRQWREAELKSSAPPSINLYKDGAPPKGHRSDCHPDQILTKTCTCRRKAVYKKGGMPAVEKLMEGEW